MEKDRSVLENYSLFMEASLFGTGNNESYLLADLWDLLSF